VPELRLAAKASKASFKKKFKTKRAMRIYALLTDSVPARAQLRRQEKTPVRPGNREPG